ncbi:hypothetical protein PRIPAC_83631 [Pristionchus pacificus]|uniref:Zinc finger protein n=1 Tax=Pristionchus pacificus TaxID=54126 RepID=A0A2A6BNQ9_PRIPA|nr:hypothetical protein PRIPAC_83631 [Pristionchus pacificus]|eukprot:PDM67456.1 zinc finger protein [Pristionchus pacificus]
MAPRTFAKPRYRCKKTSTEQSSSLDVLNDQSPSSSIILPQSEHPSGSHSRISEPSVLEPVPFSGPSPFPPFMEAPQDTPTLPPPGYGSWNDSTFRVRARATTRPSAHSSQLSLHRTPMPPPRTSLSDEHAMPQSMDGLVSSHGMDAFADTFSPAIAPPTRLPAIDGPTASSATDALMLLFAMADASETSSDSDESAILPATAHPARYPAAVGPASSSATNAPVQADAARPHGSRNRIMKIGRSSNPRVAPPPIVQRIASRGNHGPEARSVDTANAQASLEEAWNLVNYQTSNNPAHRVPILPPFDLQTRRVPISKQGVCGGSPRFPGIIPPRDNINAGARPAETVDFDDEYALISERQARRAASTTNFDEGISMISDVHRNFQRDRLAEPHRRNAFPTTLGEYQAVMMAAYEAGKEATAKEARLKQAREADNTESALALRYSRSCTVCLISPNPLVRVALTGNIVYVSEAYLRCGHIMCSPCAEQLAKIGSKVTCPFCRKAGDTLRLFEDIEDTEALTPYANETSILVFQMPLLESLLMRLKLHSQQPSTDDYDTPSFPSSSSPPIPPPASKEHLAAELQQRLEQPAPPPLPPRANRTEPPALPPRSPGVRQTQSQPQNQPSTSANYANPDIFVNLEEQEIQQPPPIPLHNSRPLQLYQSTVRPQELHELQPSSSQQRDYAEANCESDAASPRYSRACVICFEPHPRVRVVLTACGHAVCRECADALANAEGMLDCPLCRARTGYVRLFENLEAVADNSQLYGVI